LHGRLATVIEREQTSVQLSYGIPYRRHRGGIEFCLFLFPQQRDWDFPQAVDAGENGEKTELLLAPCLEAGFDGQLDDIPLGQFEASRGDVVEMVTAFLVEVNRPVDGVNNSRLPRHRWCLVEEAKLRIRRKPLRHLLDVAHRRLARS
jgi:hypothetical protein